MLPQQESIRDFFQKQLKKKKKDSTSPNFHIVQ